MLAVSILQFGKRFGNRHVECANRLLLRQFSALTNVVADCVQWASMKQRGWPLRVGASEASSSSDGNFNISQVIIEPPHVP